MNRGILKGLLLGLSIISFILLISCGGGGGGDNTTTTTPTIPTTPTSNNSISGVASKGFVSGGNVSVFAITATGQKGELLVSGQTDSTGNYNVEVDYDGPALVEVTGGEYIDEASGQSISLSGTLRAAIPVLSGSDIICVTPLTELAVRMAEKGAAGLTAEKITGANNLLFQLIDTDILSTSPTNCQNGEAFSVADPGEQNYALLLAAISKMAQTAGKDVFEVIKDIELDLDDGRLDATGPDLQSGLDGFLSGDTNDTGWTEATSLTSSIADAMNIGIESVYAITTSWLQYRVFEDPAISAHFRGWFEISKNGGLVELSEVSSFTLRNSAGTIIDPIATGGNVAVSVVISCDTTSCSGPMTSEYTGFGAHYDTLQADLYTIEFQFADGQTTSAEFTYPGQLELPIIESTLLQAQWVGTDLSLSWTNPVGAANWNEVDSLRIVIGDSIGKAVLYVKVDPANESITIPSNAINQAMGIGTGNLTSWHIQTRAYSENGINYARGVSKRVDLPDILDSYAINFAFLQYRTYEDPMLNRYEGVLGIENGGNPIGPNAIYDADITNSAGSVEPYWQGTWRSNNMGYNCINDPCTQGSIAYGTGGWALFDALVADNYRISISMDNGQTLVRDIYYPGRLELPVVSSETMTSQWNQGNLVLGWENPVNEINWSMVDQLRVVIFDESGNDIIYARPDITAESITIPSTVLNQSVGLNGGNSAVQWHVETRAHDANNMAYARGYSKRVFIADRPYALKHIKIMYRNNENGASTHVILFEITDQGNTILEQQAGIPVIKDHSNNIMNPIGGGFWLVNSYDYDCISGTCISSGPAGQSGFRYNFDALGAGNYEFQVQMDNGQVLKAERLYPGTMALPFISSSSMSSSFNASDDLILNWTNPVGDPNWGEVEKLRIAIYDDAGRDVLYVWISPDVETVTIPSALVNQAATLEGGSKLNQWQIQTRAFFENSMNYARGNSNRIDLN